jgi:hypothetical protein
MERSRAGMSQVGSLSEDEPSVKRRKVRKGTQSCWECRRRKVRCTFEIARNTICDNCLRRKTKCTSQEYFENHELPKKSNGAGVEARLSRVEDVLQQLVNNVDTTRQNRFITNVIPEQSASGSGSETLAALEDQLQAEVAEVSDCQR